MPNTNTSTNYTINSVIGAYTTEHTEPIVSTDSSIYDYFEIGNYTWNYGYGYNTNGSFYGSYRTSGPRLIGGVEYLYELSRVGNNAVCKITRTSNNTVLYNGTYPIPTSISEIVNFLGFRISSDRNFDSTTRLSEITIRTL